MNKYGDVKQVNGEWFMFMEYFDVCDACETEDTKYVWINIQKAIDNIKKI